MNKKIVLLSLLGATTILILGMGVYVFSSYNNAMKLEKSYENISSYYKRLSLGESLTDELNLKAEEASSLLGSRKYKNASTLYKEVIDSALEKIKGAVEAKMSAATKRGYNIEEAQTLFDEGLSSWDNNKYDKTIEYLWSCYEKTENTIKSFQEKAEASKPEITTEIQEETIKHLLEDSYKISHVEILMDGSWAVATVTPLTFVTDDAALALQRTDEGWKSVAGPGTYFAQEDFPNIPDEVINALNGGLQ